MSGEDFVVSADGHIVEPTDLFHTRLPRHLRDRGFWEEDFEIEPLVEGGVREFARVRTPGFEGWAVSRYRHFDGTPHTDAAIKAWQGAGLSPEAFAAITPVPYGAAYCEQGRVQTIDAVVCEYHDQDTLTRGKSAMLDQWGKEGVNTGVAFQTKLTLLGVLDRGRRDVLPARGDDQFLLPVGHRHEPIGVDGADVAGVQPPVRVDEGLGQVGPVQVAGRGQRPAGQDLAVAGETVGNRGRAHLGAGGRAVNHVAPSRPPSWIARWYSCSLTSMYLARKASHASSDFAEAVYAR